MSYTLTIATDADRTLVVEAIRAAAEQRTRVARGAAGNVQLAKAAGQDVRAKAVRVTLLLAEADRLSKLATELEDAPLITVVTPTSNTAASNDSGTTVAVTEGGMTTVVAAPAVDDGTSSAAQALAELAGLRAADPDAVEDPLTGAVPEDEPLEVEDALG